MTTYQISNKTSRVFDKDYGEGAVVYVRHGYADVESDTDLRSLFTEPTVLYVSNGFAVPRDSDLAAALPGSCGPCHVIHAFSEDGRKAKVTWKDGTTCCMPDDY